MGRGRLNVWVLLPALTMGERIFIHFYIVGVFRRFHLGKKAMLLRKKKKRKIKPPRVLKKKTIYGMY